MSYTVHVSKLYISTDILKHCFSFLLLIYAVYIYDYRETTFVVRYLSNTIMYIMNKHQIMLFNVQLLPTVLITRLHE